MEGATHLYKGKPVKFIELTYENNGQQFCTILMVNKTGKTQRQTVQTRHLTKRVPDAGESAASQALSPQSGESTPEVDPAATQRR